MSLVYKGHCVYRAVTQSSDISFEAPNQPKERHWYSNSQSIQTNDINIQAPSQPNRTTGHQHMHGSTRTSGDERAGEEARGGRERCGALKGERGTARCSVAQCNFTATDTSVTRTIKPSNYQTVTTGRLTGRPTDRLAACFFVFNASMHFCICACCILWGPSKVWTMILFAVFFVFRHFWFVRQVSARPTSVDFFVCWLLSLDI